MRHPIQTFCRRIPCQRCLSAQRQATIRQSGQVTLTISTQTEVNVGKVHVVT